MVGLSIGLSTFHIIRRQMMLRPVLLLVLPTVVGGYSVGITGDVNLNPSLKAQDPTYVGVMFRAV